MLMVGGDNILPSVLDKKLENAVIETKVFFPARVSVVVLVSGIKTAAWNQKLRCLHISGPPASP